MRLILLILYFLHILRFIEADCPCCSFKYEPFLCNCPIQRAEPPIIIPSVPFLRNQTKHPKLIAPFRDGIWISSVPNDGYREDDIWRQHAIELMWKERDHFHPTPLIHLKSSGLPNVDFTLKDETFTPTNSISYRSAWKLIVWALLKGLIRRDSHFMDYSFGNMAIAEAYFANLLTLNYTAIVPDNLDDSRRLLLKTYKANIVFVKPNKLLSKAEEMALDDKYVFLNHYSNAKYTLAMEDNYFERTSLNIMAELIDQLYSEDNLLTLPRYFVVPASTGSTITSIGYFAKKYNLPIEIVLADTEFSTFYDYVLYGKFTNNETSDGLWIEPGVDEFGFGRFEFATIQETTSLNPNVIDRVLKIPDLASVASMHFLRSIKIDCGPATGLSFLAGLSIAAKEKKSRQSGQSMQIALLIFDSGRFYNTTYYNQTWIDSEMASSGGFKNLQCWIGVIDDCLQTDKEPLEIGIKKCPSPVQKLISNL